MGAEIVLLEPWITVRLNGVVELAALTARLSPPGFDAKAKVTVFGSSRTLRVP